jgi:hypothetical protein
MMEHATPERGQRYRSASCQFQNHTLNGGVGFVAARGVLAPRGKGAIFIIKLGKYNKIYIAPYDVPLTVHVEISLAYTCLRFFNLMPRNIKHTLGQK